MPFVFSPCWAEDTANPVQSYATFHNLAGGRIIYKWQIDINNDGRNDILLDTKLTPTEIAEENSETKNQYDPNVHGFAVYIAKADGNGYAVSTGISEGGELGLGVVPEINTARCFVGQITQLNMPGIVTVQTESPRAGSAKAKIYAYTIEGDHLKRTLLAEYNPEQTNAIYDQHLSDGHRTQVQLQEVSP